MKENTFYTIYPFMINDLNLKGTERDIYAIIYGFCKNGKGEFSGSLKYLCDCTLVTKMGIMKALKKLCDKGYIIKHSEVKNHITSNTYSINFDIIKTDEKIAPPTSKQSLPPDKQSLPHDKQSLPPDKQSLPHDKQSLPPTSKQSLPPDKQSLPNKYSNNYNTDIDVYSHVVSSFNKFCPSLEKVKDITTTTKKQIDILIEKGYKEEDFSKAFIIAERSSFLTGKKGAFKATLGWILKVENFESIRHQKKYVDFDKKTMLEFDLSGAVHLEEDYECFINNFDNFDSNPKEEEEVVVEEKTAVSDDEDLLSPEEAKKLAKKYLSPESYENFCRKCADNLKNG